MTIVMGFEQHRAQITTQWLDSMTGEIARVRIAPLTARGCAGSLPGSPVRNSRLRWRPLRAGAWWLRSCAE